MAVSGWWELHRTGDVQGSEITSYDPVMIHITATMMHNLKDRVRGLRCVHISVSTAQSAPLF